MTDSLETQVATLFDPITIGRLQLRNRVMMAPLTRCRASEGRVPNALMAEYYRQRAGAGLIISEATAVSPMGVGYPNTPGIWSEEQVEGWKLVTDAVHAEGGKIVLQLWHVGRISDPAYLQGRLPVAPSALAAEGMVALLRPRKAYGKPRALELAEIPEVVESYRVGAENALKAGFDGAEIHGANGYLPNQFLNANTNLRTDAYGGSIENRARFLLEVVDAAISVWGHDRVGLHLSPGDSTYMSPAADGEAAYEYVIKQMNSRGLAFLCVRESVEVGTRYGPELRKLFTGVYIANEGFSLETAKLALVKREADAVAFGKLYIANPDLPERFARGAQLNVPNPATFYPLLEVGYTDYPNLESA